MKNEKQSWMPLIVVCLAMLSLYFLASGINVVIKKVYEDLNTTVSTIQLSLVLASLVSGSLMITAGKIGAKIGMKKTLIIGLVIFITGAIIALISPNESIFVMAWGFIWPLGMVLIVPTTVAMVTYYYQGTQRAMAFGVYGAVASLAVTLGPIGVGFLADQISWRYAMSISPVLALVTILLAFKVQESEKDSSIKIDFPSVLLSFLGLATFLIGMMMGGTYGFIIEKRPFELFGTILPLAGLSVVVLVMIIAIVFMYLFMTRTKQLINTGKEPLIDPSIFSNKVYSAGLFSQTILYIVIPGISFILPLFLQSINAYGPSETALTMLPGTATMAVVALFTPNLGKFIAPKYIIISGFIIIVASTFLVLGGIGSQIGEISLTMPLIVFGTGAGLVMSQIANLTLSSVDISQASEASGIAETFKEAIGGGFGIALISTIVLGMWYSSFIDNQLAIEEKHLTDQEKTELVIKLEDQINDGPTVKSSSYYNTLSKESKDYFDQIDFESGKYAITQTMWVIRLFLIIAIGLSLLFPTTKLS
ncbi:MFS transporter [Flammeovirga yaeyamensis]|uniref:MFS transporter n=1 Tax=Flammeovirga yaeyamensis TaxID=367791 RepID=A0AAX1N352_9BACT|nr:MFS transporter [Flammeovirga yaeyamensis]MBB3700549.1 MFS family permease [Flammeovirga yaeyamensis]NMF37666.1 MFS transporter [Flammeovirga yaeyamensis]QWG01975.1 MFS transporter [Flammeovirga yaeyamensis]